jgi:hypothetical protein
MTNEKPYCKLTVIRSELKKGTKTVFVEIEREEKLIDRQYYDNIIDAAGFMRRLGGSEHHEKSYTQKGLVVTRVTSKSPDRHNKTVFSFDFRNIQ